MLSGITGEIIPIVLVKTTQWTSRYYYEERGVSNFDQRLKRAVLCF